MDSRTSATLVAPDQAEVERVDAWRRAEAEKAAAREREQAARRPCPLHGPAGRIMYGPAPWGYGPVCGRCRREWSRRNGGKPWESAEQGRARLQAEQAAMMAEVELMPPAEFYAAWESLRSERQEAGRAYRLSSGDPDEFGVNGFGSATPDGRRYHAMRSRVRRELRAFEEARDEQ